MSEANKEEESRQWDQILNAWCNAGCPPSDDANPIPPVHP